MSHRFEPDEAFCARLLGGDDRVDADAAYDRYVAQRGGSRSAVPRVFGGILAAAAVVMIVIFAAPLQSIAGSFLAIFQPKHFAAIDVSSLNGRLLPNLSAFGTDRTTHTTLRAIASPGDADGAVGFHVLVPTSLPTDLPRPAHYAVGGLVQESFIFDARKLLAWQRRTRRALPPMPARLDGTSLEASYGPIVVQSWGADPTAKNRAESVTDVALVIVQAKTPVVHSNGATLAELEAYVLSIPGISPVVEQQIRAIGNPETTLPIPFNAAKQTAQKVTVNGVSGIAIGDDTGVGAGVVWQKNGVVYFVGGQQSEDQVMRVADGLH